MPCTCTQICCISVLKVRLRWFEADLVIFHGIETCYISNERSLVSIYTILTGWGMRHLISDEGGRLLQAQSRGL